MKCRILNQYRTDLGRKVWKEYAKGDRTWGTRYNLMAFSIRPDDKTTAVMASGQGGVNILLEIYETTIIYPTTTGERFECRVGGGTKQRLLSAAKTSALG